MSQSKQLTVPDLFARNDDECTYGDKTAREWAEEADRANWQLDIYKPLFLSLLSVLAFSMVFCCFLIIPARRRYQLKQMVKVRMTSHEAENFQTDNNLLSEEKTSTQRSATPIATLSPTTNLEVKEAKLLNIEQMFTPIIGDVTPKMDMEMPKNTSTFDPYYDEKCSSKKCEDYEDNSHSEGGYFNEGFEKLETHLDIGPPKLISASSVPSANNSGKHNRSSYDEDSENIGTLEQEDQQKKQQLMDRQYHHHDRDGRGEKVNEIVYDDVTDKETENIEQVGGRLGKSGTATPTLAPQFS